MAYSFNEPTIGLPQVADCPVLIAPFTQASNLPGVELEAQLGEMRKAWDPSLGGATFIYLAFPASTAIPLGSLVVWSQVAGDATNPYQAVVLPAGASSKNTGQAVGVMPYAVASNTAIQYGWVQVQGACSVLKTAVTVSPGNAIYASATAGRFYVTSSTGKQVLGCRTANTATVTSTTSTVLTYINFPIMEGA